MRIRLVFLLKYICFWLLLFDLGKIAFLLYEHTQSFVLPFSDWLHILQHGFRMDLSTTGYFLLLPALILAMTSPLNGKFSYYILNVYTLVMLIVFMIITLIDLEIYKYWGTRLDSAPLRFLSTPGDTLASSNLITLILYFSALGFFSLLFYTIYLRYLANELKNAGKARIQGVVVFVLFAASLIIPIRGGFSVSVINTGSAFFHKNIFANHAAINVIWNFGHSLVEHKESTNPYIYFKNKDYEADLKQLYMHKNRSVKIISTERPNIILIILESFTAKLIEPLGGAKGVTPNFNDLCKHGVLFSNIYSTDSRTDKGLATVLSGYPVLEAIPILKYPDKTQHLPYLSKSLITRGYHASFLYGGDVDFANMRSYLVNGDFSKIISEADFPARERTGKWGVPDQYAYIRFLSGIRADSGRWFQVMLSISNHEPFEIPVRSKFGSDNLTDKFHSSAYYADSCLGDFIRRFRETSQWDSTVIIMVADHGTRVPDFSEVYEPRKFHIPLFITGGAVVKDTVVDKLGSQADIAVTLLNQLNIGTEDYLLGKDLLAPDSKSFVFYSYKNGIALLTDSTGFGLDFSVNSYSFKYGEVNEKQDRYARMMQQFVYDNYLRLSRKSFSKLEVRK
jgi:phosphoglycerol transferase MdoB-like AlkP superfamily enzyme